MRVAICTLLVGLSFLLSTNSTNAQGFGGSGSTYLQIGLGASEHFSSYRDYDHYYNYRYGGLYFQAEFGLAKYFGVGFGLGLENSLAGRNYYYNGYYYNGKGYRHVGIPVFVFANFHFLQAIADKQGEDYADKFDVYLGLNAGFGPVFRSVYSKYKDDKYYTRETGYMLFGGAHLGARFFPKENLGFYLEVGYGKQVMNIGAVFKM